MRVILLKDVRGVGRQGEVVEVADGYGFNSLIPAKAAEQATPAKLAAHAAKVKQLGEMQAKAKETLVLAVQSLENARIQTKVRATEKGGLFKSLSKIDVVKLVREQKSITLPEHAIQLEAPIKQVGEHTLKIRVEGAEATLTLSIEQL